MLRRASRLIQVLNFRFLRSIFSVFRCRPHACQRPDGVHKPPVIREITATIERSKQRFQSLGKQCPCACQTHKPALCW